MRMLALVSVLLSLGADWYVAPDGKPHPSGFGTIDSPWDLSTAVGSGRLAAPTAVKSGDTIWMRGGTYQVANLQVKASGITIKSYPGEWARWDAYSDTVSHPYVEFLGADNTYEDFELFDSNPRSRFATTAAGNRCRFGIYHRSKLRRLIIHDLQGSGLGDSNRPTGGSEMVGCVIYNHGWVEGRHRGHGLYLQNRGERKLVQACVVFNVFGKGTQVYGSSASVNENVHIIGTTFFNNGGPGVGLPPNDQDILFGGDTPIINGIVERCRVYTNSLQGMLDVGYGFSPYPNETMLVKDNYVAGGIRNLSKFPWPDLVMENNTTVRTPQSENKVFVEPDPSQDGRYIITVFNWRLLDSVSVPLSAVDWKAQHVARIGETVASGDGQVILPMSDISPHPVIGHTLPPVTLSKQFGCFVLTSGGGTVPPPPPPPPGPVDPPPPPPPPPSSGLSGELVGDPASKSGATLIIKREGKEIYRFLYIRQFAIYDKFVYRLNTQGRLIRSLEDGRLATVLYPQIKSFSVSSDGTITTEK